MSALPQQRQRSAIQLVARFREAGILAVLLLLILFVAWRNANFLTISNIKGIGLDITILMVLAIGETVVILTRNIDISISSILGFTSLSVGVIVADHPGIPVVGALALGMLLGLGFGLFNGVLVTFGQVPSIIVTIGTLGIFRGLVFVYSSTVTHPEVTAADLPSGLLNLATETILGIPVFLLVPAVLLVIAGYWLRQTRSGREVYAVGGNPAAARLAGISSTRTVLLAFALSGALAGLGGVLYTARFAQVDTLAGNGLELNVVAAVVIGGTSTLGGVGGVLGTLIGCVLLGVINNALVLLSGPGEGQFWQRAVYGAIIIGAVVADTLISGQLQKVLRGGGRS